MANFDAGGFEPVTYDFTKYVPDAKGEIPEPSGHQLDEFLEKIQVLFPASKGPDGKVRLDVDTLVKKVNEDGLDVEKFLHEAIADLCSNTPTAEQITGLPPRLRQRFYGFVFGTYLLPEA